MASSLDGDRVAEILGVVESMTDGLLVVERDTRRTVRFGRRLLQRLGGANGHATIDRLDDIFTSDGQQQLQAALAAARNADVLRIEALPCRNRQGEMVFADLSLRGLHVDGQDYWVAMLSDVSAKKRLDDCLAIHRDLGLKLACAADPAAAMEVIVAAMKEIAGVDAAVGYLIESNPLSARLAASHGVAPQAIEALRRLAPPTPHFQLLYGKEPIYRSWDQCEEPIDQLMLLAGMRGMAILPIVYEGKTIAAVCAASRVRFVFEASARHCLEFIAGRTATLLSRLHAEGQARRCTARMDMLLQHMPDFFVLLRPDGQAEYANRPPTSMTMEAAMSDSALAMLTREHRPTAAAALTAAFRGEPQRIVVQAQTGHWYDARIVPLSEHGRIERVMLISRDVTDQWNAQRQLADREARLRLLLDNIPDHIVVVDAEAKILLVNRSLGPLPADELVGKCGLSFIAAEYLERARQAHAEALAGQAPDILEVRDVYGRWWSCQLVPLTIDGQTREVMIINTEITDRKNAAAALKGERELLRDLLELHERDRRLIAYEIHDGMAQHLAGVAYALQAARQTAAAAQPSEHLGRAIDLLENAMEDVRRLISGACPPVLDELGLAAATEFLVNEHRRKCGLRIELSLQVDFVHLARPLENAVFRIVQESLVNACHHSGSALVRVAMVQSGQRLQVEIRDWGRGFDPSKIPARGFGLRGIRERARLFEGDLSIVSSPGQGTQIAVDFPILPESPPPASEADDWET